MKFVIDKSLGDLGIKSVAIGIAKNVNPQAELSPSFLKKKKEMEDWALALYIRACPIVREADGLALSSRNVRLTPEGRAAAPAIYRILSESRSWARELTPAELIERVTREINAIPTLRVEYFEIVDTDSLQPIASWSDSPAPHGCITVYCGEVRLIDNIAYH